jgi:hypothetical protein
MAIVVSNNALITVDGVDLTDHCTSIILNDGQESKEITHLRSTTKNYRAGMGLASIEATFMNDAATGSVMQKLHNLMLFENIPSYRSAPPAAALAGLGAGAMAVGTYLYGSTLVWPAFETAGSTSLTSITTTGSNMQVNLTSIVTTSGYSVPTAWNLYRTQLANGTSSTLVLVTTITVGTTGYTDNTSSSALIGAASFPVGTQVTGFPVVVRKFATAQGANNPNFTLTALVDGQVNLLDEKPGEISTAKVTFKKFGTFAYSAT